MSSFKIISKKRSAGSNTLHTLTYNEYGFSPPGIDGKHAINNLISCRYNKSTELFKKDLYAHYGCVNAIEFSQDGKLMISGGDDRRVLLWNVEKGISGVGKPVAMRGEHHSNIFCLAFDSAKNRVFSGSNDEQLIVHDAHTGELLKVLSLGDAVYCISVDPSNDNAFAAACENGRIYMFDCRESYNQDNMPILISKRSAFHAVQHNPLVPNLLVTANSKKGVTLWDLRWPRNALLKYNCGLVPTSSAMSVQFNSRGTQIAALRRRLPPILYNVGSPHPIAEFEHNDYYNSCTMKTCCFAGPNDEFVLSGSDDFKLYVWKIPENLMKSDMNDESCQWVDKTHLVLSGHRSIVNHVRYNSPNAIIASSGVEKIIKVWSPFNISDDNQVKTNSKRAMQNRRHIYSNEEYLSLILDSADALSSNDSNVDSVAEDPKMIAFFDTLVQRDIMGASSESDGDIEDETLSESSMTRLPFENPAVSDSNEDEDEIGNISPDEQPDLMQTLDPRSIDYIEKFCDRMNSMTQKLSNGEVSRNFAGYSLSMVSPIKLVRDLRDSQSDHDSRDFYFNDKRGISNKMLEKKKEQLRKHARSALRVMRFRLHKLRKILSKKKDGDSTSDADEVQVLKEQLEHVMKLLESVSCRSDRSSRDERRTLRARLRSLTYTSRNDFLRSPRQPIEIDSSDSDGSLQAGFLNLQNLLSNEDTQSSNNSSSQIRSPDSNHAFNDFESDDPSEPGDADDDDDDVDGGENDGTNHRSGPILDFKKFNLKLNYDTSDSDSSSDSDSDSENDSTPPNKSRVSDKNDGDILEPAQSRMCLDEQQPSDSNQATNVSSHDSNGDINDVHKTSKKSTDPSLLFDMQANGETASTIPEPGPSNNRESSTNQQEPSISFFKNVKNDSSSKRCFRKRRINDETGSNCEKNSKNLRIT